MASRPAINSQAPVEAAVQKTPAAAVQKRRSGGRNSKLLRGWQFIATLSSQNAATTHAAPPTSPNFGQPTMDKRAKKKIQAINQRIQKLRQQLAGARKQMDDPRELKALEEQLAAAEAELAKAKGS